MGANQSTRSITVVKDEASGVIKVSDAVVQRLRGEITGEQTPAPTPAPAPVEAPPAPISAPPVVEATPAPPAEQASPAVVVQAAASEAPGQAAHGNVWQRPIIQYIEEPSISALRVRTEKEAELSALETYWKDRLGAMEQEHVDRQKLTEKEISASVKLVGGLFKPAAPAATEICREASDAVQSCYSSNASQPLLCREQVAHFSQCVQEARSKLLASSG